MADTATDLKERLSPSAIKAEVTDYVRDLRDQLWNKLEQSARDNPLQESRGAAIAYPAIKLLRSMPAPLLLVGAGLLLSKTTAANQNVVLSEAADAVGDRAKAAVGAASDAVDDAADTGTAQATRHSRLRRGGVSIQLWNAWLTRRSSIKGARDRRCRQR